LNAEGAKVSQRAQKGSKENTKNKYKNKYKKFKKSTTSMRGQRIISSSFFILYFFGIFFSAYSAKPLRPLRSKTPRIGIKKPQVPKQ
jgi:hypothetical protein